MSRKSSNGPPSSSQIVDLTNSPYPLSQRDGVIDLVTPVQSKLTSTNAKEEFSTPPKPTTSKSSESKDSAHRSPYSPSRNSIPPLPVPANMDIQLKATIPNSKRKFDINKLAFGGDSHGAALDELKTMLDSIQNALVNIVERSKGNSSHIQLFGTQLREFNETFKQRQENEDDLLTTSAFKESQASIIQSFGALKRDIADTLKNALTSDDVQRSIQYQVGELAKMVEANTPNFEALCDKLAKIEEALHTKPERDIVMESITRLHETVMAESKQNKEGLAEQQRLIEAKTQNNHLADALEKISHQQLLLQNSIDSQRDGTHFEELKSSLAALNQDVLSVAQQSHKDTSVENLLTGIQDALQFEKILAQNAELMKTLEQLAARDETFEQRLTQIEAQSKERENDLQNEIRELKAALMNKDEIIDGLSKQQSEAKMSFLEEKFSNLKVAELNTQLQEYRAKESLQLSTIEIINQTIEAKTEYAKLEKEMELKAKALEQISSTYNSRLDQFIALAGKYEELKAKTEAHMSSGPPQQLLNNLRFDYDQTSAPSTSSSGVISAPTDALKVKKRNVTLNENMLSTFNKLQPLDLNSYEKNDMSSGVDTTTGKRKAQGAAEKTSGNYLSSESIESFYKDYSRSPQNKKVHVSDFDKENCG